MYWLIFLAATAFLLSFGLTPLIRDFFRKRSAGAPRVGGVAIALSYLLAYVVFLGAGSKFGYLTWQSIDFALRLIPAAALILAIGLLEDLRRIEPWHKVAGEIAAACLAWWAAGVHIQALGGFELGASSMPLTVAWILACTAAIRLIDGVDGLAAGIGLFATCTTAVAALLQNNAALALATIPLAGAILGFLRYNFSPASIFLGESGALFIGFLLGCYSIVWSQKAATILGMTAPLLVLSVPLLDAVLAVLRRFLRRQPIFEPDTGQIHQRLLHRGLTPRKVALILYACTAAGAVGSIFVSSNQGPDLVIVVFCTAAWIGVQHLGYVEFGVAGRLFMEGAFRRQLNAQMAIQSYETRLNAAATPAECWTIIEEGLKTFGFNSAYVAVGGSVFAWQCAAPPSREAWELHVPIAECDSVRLTRSFAAVEPANTIAPFTELMRKTLAAKRGIFVDSRRAIA